MAQGSNPGGNEPDGVTITRNGSGQLQSVKRNKVLADFENDLGAWTTDGQCAGTLNVGRKQSSAYNGLYSGDVRCYNPDAGDYAIMKRSIDLSKYSEISFHLTTVFENSDGEFSVAIGENTVFSKTLTSISDNTKLSFDVKDESGTAEIVLRIDVYKEIVDDNAGVYFDYMKGLQPSEIVDNSPNGAGGTA